jgi:hypothetical protein
LLLANEVEAALRWSAAVVERDASIPSALVITCRLLEQMGRTEAAIDGFQSCGPPRDRRGQPPFGHRGDRRLARARCRRRRSSKQVAAAFCEGSPRLQETETPPPPLPRFDGFQPLSSFLTGPALTSRATQILHSVSREYDEAADTEMPLVAPLPLFSALGKDALRELVAAFEMITVPVGPEYVIREGEEGAEAYIVARGELEVTRGEGLATTVGPPIVLARLGQRSAFR